ncbi:MAG: prevent-host-death protein [Actinomycetes bacterium]
MPEVIAQRVLRDDNAAIIERVAHGESFIVTRSGQPIAELCPLSTAHRRTVSREGLRAAFEGVGPRLDSAAFRRDLDQAIE